MFCIVSDGQKPTATSVSELRADPTGAWVIDAWANVCCPSRHYQREFTEQMARWSRQGKFVTGVSPFGPDVQVDTSSYEYLSGVTHATLKFTKGASSP